MKIRVPTKHPRAQKDENKSSAMRDKLKAISERKRKEQLALAAPAAREVAPVSGAKVTVRMNVSGNMRGMHAAGDSAHMKKVRAMRRFYNKQMPVLQCSGCAFAASCPQYKAGYECAFLPFLDSHNVDSESDLIEAMKVMVSGNMRRAHLATLMETLSGGAPSLETSEALNLTFMQLKGLHETMTKSQGEVTVEGDETIIGRLFGNVGNLLDHTRKAVDSPIDVAPAQLPETERPLVLAADSDVNHEIVREHSVEELIQLSGRKRSDVESKVAVSSNKL